MNIFTVLLVQPLANGLVIFYRLLGGNLGLAIIGFSLFLRFILNPLTKPYTESMKKMREVAPQLEKLKKKHKNDKVKLAQAQSDLYKSKGINPSAGCLPYLLQIVVLIAFFNMFSRTLSADTGTTEAFNALLYSPLRFSDGHMIDTNFLIWNLSKPDTYQFSFIPFAVPGVLLVIAAITQLVSAKIMAPYDETQEKLAKQTPDKSDDFQASMQKSLVYTFPLMTLFIGMRFPAGLALYWLMFSIYQAFQQHRSQGWGGMTPWIKRLGLIKSGSQP